MSIRNFKKRLDKLETRAEEHKEGYVFFRYVEDKVEIVQSGNQYSMEAFDKIVAEFQDVVFVPCGTDRDGSWWKKKAGDLPFPFHAPLWSTWEDLHHENVGIITERVQRMRDEEEEGWRIYREHMKDSDSFYEEMQRRSNRLRGIPEKEEGDEAPLYSTWEYVPPENIGPVTEGVQGMREEEMQRRSNRLRGIPEKEEADEAPPN